MRGQSASITIFFIPTSLYTSSIILSAIISFLYTKFIISEGSLPREPEPSGESGDVEDWTGSWVSEVFALELLVARVLFGSNGSKIESSFGVEDVAESSSILTADPWSEIFW